MKQKQTLEILAKLSKQHLEFVSSATTRFKQQDELNQQLQLQIKVMNEKIQQIQVGLEELLECHAIDMNQLKEKVTLSLDKYAQYVQKQCTTEVKLGELENHLNETLHNIQEIQQNSIREDNLIVGTDDDEEERVNSPEKKQEEDPSKLPIELIMNNRANTTPCTSIEANKCVPPTLSSKKNENFKCPVFGCRATRCSSLERLGNHMQKFHPPPCVVCNKTCKDEKSKMEHDLQHTPKCTHSIVNDGECAFCKETVGFLHKDVVSSTRFISHILSM